MPSQSLLTSSHCMQLGQPLQEFGPLPAHLSPKSSVLPTALDRLHCLPNQGSLQGSLPKVDAHKFHSNVLRRRRFHIGRVRDCLTVCRSGPMEESQQLGDGPIEPLRPRFSRLPHSSLSFIPADDPAAAPLPPKKIKISTRRGGRQRRWKKATPAQAMAGAIFAGLWAALALKGTMLAYEHLESHPLAHDLPMGMTNKVNQLLISSTTGFGAFAVVLFSVCSFGLALLTVKLISAPKTPLQ